MSEDPQSPEEAIAALRDAVLEAVSPFLRWVLLRMEDVLLIAAKAERRIWRRK